jgi:DNA-binding MarR family transcriptional regulator
LPPKSKSTGTPSLGHLASDLRLVCMRISRRARYESTNRIAPHQFSVLCRLQENPRTPKELAETERVSAPSMTRTVAGLVEAGLVSRTDDPTDGRQVIVALTEEGRAVWRDVRRRRDQWMAQRLRDLSPEDREVLARASEILARVVSE